MQIKVYRGTHQIGGCITEISTENARVVIDIGEELPSDKIFPSKPIIDGVTSGKKNCDAVFVTHYHGDHIGAFADVLPDIPIYMGKTAKQIFAVVQRTLQQKLRKGNPERAALIKTFEVAKPIQIKDITVTPYCVDHSAFDAYMFLIESEGKRVLHTGDFRLHGARGSKMAQVFEKYAGDLDLLITEGTMLSRMEEKAMTEHELGRKAKLLMRKEKNVFILCSSTNIDSIAEFYNAAVQNSKPFIVCEKNFQSEILRIVTENSTSSFYNFNKHKLYTYAENLHEMMLKHGFCFLGRTNFATQKAMNAFPDNTLIYSAWKGYLDRNHPAFDRHKSEFIEKAIEKGSKLEYLHTSGHASMKDIEKICNLTKAKTIIPIHSSNPEQLKFLETYGQLKILQDGESFIV